MSVLWLWDSVQDSPDEATKFSGDRSDSDMTMFALVKSVELFVKPVLSLESNANDLRRLSLATSIQNEFGGNSIPVVQAASTRGRRARMFPALVIDPRRSLSPEECSEGTRPK